MPGYDGTRPLQTQTRITCDGEGNGSAQLSATAGWLIDRMSVEGNATTPGPELRVYRNGALIDASGYANSDVSDLSRPLSMFSGEVLRLEVTRASAGAVFTFAVEGEEQP